MADKHAQESSDLLRSTREGDAQRVQSPASHERLRHPIDTAAAAWATKRHDPSLRLIAVLVALKSLLAVFIAIGLELFGPRQMRTWIDALIGYFHLESRQQGSGVVVGADELAIVSSGGRHHPRLRVRTWRRGFWPVVRPALGVVVRLHRSGVVPAVRHTCAAGITATGSQRALSSSTCWLCLSSPATSAR